MEEQSVTSWRNQAKLITKTLRSFTSALQRQFNEAVRITSMRAELIVMNSKNKWNQAPIVRVVASTGIHIDQ